MAELNILNLTCVKKNDTNRTRDEVSLHLDGTKIFGPERIGEGATIPVGGFTVPEELSTLPGNTDHHGVFDDELPDTFYYIEYHVTP